MAVLVDRVSTVLDKSTIIQRHANNEHWPDRLRLKVARTARIGGYNDLHQLSLRSANATAITSQLYIHGNTQTHAIDS